MPFSSCSKGTGSSNPSADVVAGRLPVATSADGFEDPVPFEQLLKGT